MFCVSSLIQTLLSVLEFHQISRICGSRTFTAGREFLSVTLPRRTFSVLLEVSYNRRERMSIRIIFVDKP